MPIGHGGNLLIIKWEKFLSDASCDGCILAIMLYFKRVEVSNSSIIDKHIMWATVQTY